MKNLEEKIHLFEAFQETSWKVLLDARSLNAKAEFCLEENKQENRVLLKSSSTLLVIFLCQNQTGRMGTFSCYSYLKKMGNLNSCHFFELAWRLIKIFGFFQKETFCTWQAKNGLFFVAFCSHFQKEKFKKLSNSFSRNWLFLSLFAFISKKRNP